MLKRVYIDNFSCFVNFELSLGAQQLILGLNGTGKSTFIEVLALLKKLVTGDANPDVLFPETSRTRWQTIQEQTFELQVELDASYRFTLEIDFRGTPARTRIRREVVLCDGRPVFEFQEGEVHLFNDHFEHKVTYPFDWFRSALATVQPRPENTRLMKFKDWVKKLHCLQLNPRTMAGRTEREEPELAYDMSNFVSWYRHMTQERADSASNLQDHLRQTIPGLSSLDLVSAGANLRSLVARFAGSDAERRSKFFVVFDELSDGQRALVGLYALLDFLVQEGACLFLDEPENYVAIPEIQPWLFELRDSLGDSGGQVTLISHHPEMIDFLASDIGLVFERAGVGPVRVRNYVSDPTLSPSEQIARGWRVDG